MSTQHHITQFFFGGPVGGSRPDVSGSDDGYFFSFHPGLPSVFYLQYIFLVFQNVFLIEIIFLEYH
jgi:hypothetical protein